jgi:hypothetical protein
VPITQAVVVGIFQLLHDAKSVDEQLASWPFLLSPDWDIKLVAHYHGDGDSVEEVFPGPVHSYVDLWAANNWDYWRCYRIFCQSIVFNCCERLNRAVENDTDFTRSVRVLREMVNGICAAVPFQLGFRLPSEDIGVAPEFSKGDPDSPFGSRARGSGMGGFFTSYTLFVAFGVVCIPFVQKKWFYKRIQETGYSHGIVDKLVQALFKAKGRGARNGKMGRGMSITDFAPPEARNIWDVVSEVDRWSFCASGQEPYTEEATSSVIEAGSRIIEYR